MKKIIKWIINDFKTDIIFLRQLFKGEYKLTEKKREEIRNAFSITGLITNNWVWLLLIIAAFFCGWFIAAQHYQNVVNEFVANVSKTYIPYAKNSASNLFANLSLPK